MIKKNTFGPESSLSRVIDCDEVFDRLTAGPFPHGAADDDLIQLHLRCCHDCRTFAEAMRPAIGLFHEAIAEQARVDLPVFTGILSEDDPALLAVRKSVESAAQVALQPNRERESQQATLAARRWRIAFAAALLLMAAFASGFGLYPLWDLSKPEMADAANDARHSSALINFNEPDQVVHQEPIKKWIANIQCSKAGAELRAVFAEHDDAVTCSMLRSICCSRCHGSNVEVRVALDVEQVASLVRACGQCHDSSN
jgi:hypothetical protein